MISEECLNEYKRLAGGKGFVCLRDHAILKLSGNDRQKFLHNFCTADIKGLSEFDATEAFILDGKGRTISFGHVLILPNAVIYLFAGKANAESILQHLDK
ncbi:MAG: hypothetical protein AAGA30_20900, partial [Planctomycetota bacterium]